MTDALHADFGSLAAHPGEAHITDRHELFNIVNVIEFGGGGVERATHVPTEVGAVGPVAIWESTGAADGLPFWNTNFQSDVYLYLVHGSVRVEFKEPGARRATATTSAGPETCCCCPKRSRIGPSRPMGSAASRSSWWSGTHIGRRSAAPRCRPMTAARSAASDSGYGTKPWKSPGREVPRRRLAPSSGGVRRHWLPTSSTLSTTSSRVASTSTTWARTLL